MSAVRAGPAHRPTPRASTGSHIVDPRRLPGGVCVMGCHGGAGVTTLATLGVGIDGEWRRWPQPPPDKSPAGLLLVARLSAQGMAWASRAVEACRTRMPVSLVLLGLVVVPAAPGRPPRLARERLELVSGWMPAVFRMPWVPQLLDIDMRDVPACAPARRAVEAAGLAKYVQHQQGRRS